MNKPNFNYENRIWRSGYTLVAGVDEVGRGAFAGPVVAGCVVFKSNIPYSKFDIRIDDSKKLTAKQREVANVWIKENCLTWGVGETSAREIDRFGIVNATRKAMRKSIGNANQKFHNRVQYLLIDAFYIPYVRGIRMPLKRQLRNIKTEKLKNIIGQQLAIIKGDGKSFSIASASIIAKVYRDNLMINLGKRKKYKKYGWERNKGHGTLEHRKAIEKYGILSYHRKLFIKN